MSEAEETLAGDIACLVAGVLCRYEPADVHSDEASNAVAERIVRSGPIQALMKARDLLEDMLQAAGAAESGLEKADNLPFDPA